MRSLRTELFPFVLIVVLTLLAFAIFWAVMDMVLLGASIAVVLLPLHHRILKYTRPRISAEIVTLAVFIALAVFVLITHFILISNAAGLKDLFGSISIWLNNPATNPLDFGIPVSKATLSALLDEGTALFVDYQKTLINNLSLIVFKMLVLFVSIFSLLRWGEELKIKLTRHVPVVLTGYITKLSEVTVDTLYAIYIVQIAIAILTFFIALPVFYLLGYGNILFYSFLAAFCELIPILGSSVAFILFGTYAFALGDTRGVFILFFLGYLIVSCVPEIYVRPVLVGRRVKIHPLIMFIGIISGILTMGLAGFVLGPVIIVMITTSYRMYIKDRKDRGESGSLFEHS
ncbi:MAG: AI-2E family transporter [Methanoregula sp.]|jgi:predicted PurR-regulated permease PerM|nr:AI-2E family transporter [Methanoregula sp.]